jgi:iduronate 2-sulfatase
MLRDDRWVYIQYGEDAKGGMELFDMHHDPKQYKNLAGSSEHAAILNEWKSKLADKLRAVRTNDLGR